MGIAKGVPALPGSPDTLSGILPPVLLRATGGSVQSTYLEENLVRPMCLAKPQLSVRASGRPHCRDHAAVDQQVTAGDEGSVWTHQIGGRRADLSGAAHPAAEVLIILWYCCPAGEFSGQSTCHVELVASGCDGSDHAAVDQEVGAGDEGAVAAHQECGRGPDLVRCCHEIREGRDGALDRDHGCRFTHLAKIVRRQVDCRLQTSANSALLHR